VLGAQNGRPRTRRLHAVVSGKGAGGGFDHQARAAAYVAAHIVAEHPLKWARVGAPDVPRSIQSETGGTGDDIRVEIVGSDRCYEVQVKRNLKAGSELNETLEKLCLGLAHNSNEVAVLVVGPSSSNSVRVDLRMLLDRHRERAGQTTAESRALAVFRRLAINHEPAVLDRLHVVPVSVEDDFEPVVAAARAILASALYDPSQASAAWDIIVSESLRSIRTGGRLDRRTLVSALQDRAVRLRESATSPGLGGAPLAVGAGTASVPDMPPGGVSLLRTQLKTAKSFIDQHKPSLALEVMNTLRDEAATATASDRAYVHSLRAIAHLMRDEMDDAIPELDQVLAIEPANAAALANSAYAALMTRNEEAALKYAETLRSLDGMSVPAWVTLVQLDPSRPVPSELEHHPQILGARAFVLMKRRNWVAALELLLPLVETAKEPDLLLTAAQCLTSLALEETSPPASELSQALALVERALEELESREQSESLDRARVAKGHTLMLLGDSVGAKKYLVEASSKSPHSVAIAFLLAILCLDDGLPSEALVAVERIELVSRTPELHVAHSRALHSIGRHTDATEALRHALNQAGLGAEPDARLVALIGDAAAEIGARQICDGAIGALDSLSAWSAKLLRAKVAIRDGLPMDAIELLEAALLIAPPRHKLQLRVELADQLRAVGRLDDALSQFDSESILEPIASRVYARILYESRDVARASALIQSLMERQNHLPDWGLRLAVYVALEVNDVRDAELHLRELHRRYPAEGEVGVRLAICLHKRGDTIGAQETLVHAADQPSNSARVLLMAAGLAARLGLADKALECTERALEARPDLEDAEMAFIQLMLRRDPDDAPSVVAVGTAVGVTLDSGEVVEYLIVSGAPARESELSRDSDAGAMLIGLKVGADLTFRKGHASQSHGVVTSIKTARHFRFQRILATFRTRHPNSTRVESFSVPDNPTAGDFEFLVERVREQSATAEQLLDANRQHGGIPLGAIAQGRHVSIADAYDFLASSDGAQLAVEYSDQHAETVELARNARNVVLTASALETVARLDLFQALESTGWDLFAPQSMLDEFEAYREHLQEGRLSGNKRLLRDGDGLRLIDIPPAAFAGAIARLDHSVEWVLKHCKIKSRPVNQLKRFGELSPILGAGSADSLLLAWDLDAELYADDLGLRRLLVAQPSRKGFSTYAFVLSRDARAIDSRQKEILVARLIACRHEAIPLLPIHLAIALQRNNYRVDSALKPFVERLTDPEIHAARVIAFIATVLAEVAVQPGRPHLGLATNGLLHALADRNDATGIVRSLPTALKYKLQVLPVALDDCLAAVELYARSQIEGERLLAEP